MTTVTAKFRCDNVVRHESSAEVYLSPDCSGNYFEPGTEHPNKTFWDATPCGHLQMVITNQAAANMFEAGALYTLTFERDGE
ncbi:hypothetical protein [Acetobacter sp.]|uniref:hypothetical protein n=1 Tax=Acetobacter sp. TaxID=440 RepID=UPI0039EB5DAE